MKRLLFLLFFVLTSCDSKRSQSHNFDYVRAGVCATGASQAGDNPGIVNGQLVQERSLLGKSSVLVMQAAWDEKSNVVDQSVCTGILIDSDIVLTAAHCADFLYSKSDVETKIVVSFRARPECDRDNARKELVKVSRVVVHPSWIQSVLRRKAGYSSFSGVHFPDSNTPTLQLFGDIALLKLEKSAPDYKSPAVLPRKFLSPDSAAVYAAGFGTPVKYNDQGKSELALRYTKLHPLKKTGLAMNLFKAEDGPSTLLEDQLIRLVKNDKQNTAQQEMLIFDQTKGSGVCSGDSGGPAVMVKNRELAVLGIAAAVYAVDSREKCQHVAMHTSTTFYQKWIESNYYKLADRNSKKFVAKENPFKDFSALPSKTTGAK